MLSSVSWKRAISLQYPLVPSQPHPSLCSIFQLGLHFFSISLFLPSISHKLSRNLLFPEFQLKALEARATSWYIEYFWLSSSGSSGTISSWLQLFSGWRSRIFRFAVVLLMSDQRQGMDYLSIYLSQLIWQWPPFWRCHEQWEVFCLKNSPVNWRENEYQNAWHAKKGIRGLLHCPQNRIKKLQKWEKPIFWKHRSLAV